MEKISPANMAIVALEGHEVRIFHVDSRRRCVGVTRYFKLYFNTDFKFERTLDFFNVQKTNWTVIFKRYRRMKVTVSIIETFVIQLWSLLLMLKIFERSLIKKLNLVPLNLLGPSFDACYRLYCQMYGIYRKSWMSYPPNCLFSVLLLAMNSLLIGREIAKNSERNKRIKFSSVCSLNPDHFLSCVRPGTFVWRSISNLQSDHSLGFAPSICYS